MIKEIAIADAYGAGFEFSSSEKVAQYNDLSQYMSHDLYGFCGRYTDDTQMSIAVAELIINRTSWSEEEVAASFLKCFKRDIRLGYSKNFFNLLSASTNEKELLSNIIPSSERNGAAMRSVPLGVLSTGEEVLNAAKLQSQVTHNTEVAVAASCTVAIVSHFGLRLGGEISDIKSFLQHLGYDRWNFAWKEPVSTKAFDTVSAALTCLISHRSLKELLHASVQLGGDSDSVAAISVGLATCFSEYNQELPSSLINNLNEEEYGLAFLERIDGQLARYINDSRT